MDVRDQTQEEDWTFNIPDAEGSRANGAFRRLPNAAARDRRLGSAALVLLAWRITLIGKYEMNERYLIKAPLVAQGSGLGKNNIRKAIQQLCEADYLVRYQPPGIAEGHFGRVVERLTSTALDCGKSGNAGQLVFRRWFNGLLTLKQMATYIYLRAGTGKGPSVYAQEVADRFGWSHSSATKVISDLITLGLVRKVQIRAANGRMQGVQYRVVKRSHMLVWPPATTVKKPGDGLRADGGPADLPTSCPPHQPLLREDTSPHSEGTYTSHGEVRGEGEGALADRLHSEAFSDEHLLGWMGEEESRLLYDLLDNIDFSLSEAITDMACAVPDGVLIQRIREATTGRVHGALLTPAGLYAFRYVASFYYSTVDERDAASPLNAVAWLLNAIADRLSGPQGVWFNSLRLVAERMVGDAYGHGTVSERLYARSSSRRFVVRESD